MTPRVIRVSVEWHILKRFAAEPLSFLPFLHFLRGKFLSALGFLPAHAGSAGFRPSIVCALTSPRCRRTSSSSSRFAASKAVN